MVETMAEPCKNLKNCSQTLHYHVRFKTWQIWKGIRFKVTYSEYEDNFPYFFSQCRTNWQSPYAEKETMMQQSPICKTLKSLGIDSASGPVRQIGLSYQPARPHELVESIPWNRFLGSLKFYKFGSGL